MAPCGAASTSVRTPDGMVPRRQNIGSHIVAPPTFPAACAAPLCHTASMKFLKARPRGAPPRAALAGALSRRALAPFPPSPPAPPRPPAQQGGGRAQRPLRRPQGGHRQELRRGRVPPGQPRLAAALLGAAADLFAGLPARPPAPDLSLPRAPPVRPGTSGRQYGHALVCGIVNYPKKASGAPSRTRAAQPRQSGRTRRRRRERAASAAPEAAAADNPMPLSSFLTHALPPSLRLPDHEVDDEAEAGQEE